MATKLTPALIAEVESITGWTFQNRNLIWKSISRVHPTGDEHDHRLALVGDAVMRYILLRAWYPSYGTKGKAQDEQTNVLSNKNLARALRHCGLRGWLPKVPAAEEYGKSHEHQLGTAVEALIGAIDLESDGDMKAIKRAMQGFGLMPTDNGESEDEDSDSGDHNDYSGYEVGKDYNGGAGGGTTQHDGAMDQST